MEDFEPSGFFFRSLETKLDKKEEGRGITHMVLSDLAPKPAIASISLS